MNSDIRQTLDYFSVSKSCRDHFHRFIPLFEKVDHRLVQKKLTIQYDDSPVMASHLSFLACFDSAKQTITLNAYAVKKAPVPTLAKLFLIAHESFHSCEKNLQAELKTTGFDNESIADMFAIYRVTKD